MGKYDLDNYEYDEYLAKNKKHRQVRDRNLERLNKGYKGWHFGLGDRPVHCKDKEDFKGALKERGLDMRENVEKTLR